MYSNQRDTKEQESTGRQIRTLDQLLVTILPKKQAPFSKGVNNIETIALRSLRTENILYNVFVPKFTLKLTYITTITLACTGVLPQAIPFGSNLGFFTKLKLTQLFVEIAYLIETSETKNPFSPCTTLKTI